MRESLIMPEVKVCFCAVICYEDLAVLKRAQRAGVNIDVRVKLLDCDFQPRASRRAPVAAAAMPFPNDDTTPPVTKINLAISSPSLSPAGYQPLWFQKMFPLPLS